MSEKKIFTSKVNCPDIVRTVQSEIFEVIRPDNVRTVRFRDFWRQIWEKSIFCQKKENWKKNMKSDLWEV